MDGLHIGDIVRPTTPYKRQLFGKGMVIEIPDKDSNMYRVIFPHTPGVFTLEDFKRSFIEKVTAPAKTIKQINRAFHIYDQLSEEIKSA